MSVVKAGVYLNVVFPPLNMGSIDISRSRFKQSRNPMLITQFYVLGCKFLGDFLGEGTVFLKGLVKLGEIKILKI